MASRELSLFADLDQGRLVQGFLSTQQAILPRFVFGDSVPVSFRPLKSNGNSSTNPWSDVDLTGKTVRIAIGNPAGAASSGTFTLTYGGDTTSALSYAADSATIQTALNALASITSAGGVTVTRSTNGAIRIIFNTAGSRTAITADPSSLYPSSGAEIRVSVEGDGSTREIVVARFESLPAAYAELADDFPVAASTITETRTGSISVGAINTLEFTVLPYSGSYTLEIGGQQTLGIPWDADAATIQAALVLLSTVDTGMVEVTGEFPLFTMSFDVSLGDIGAVDIDMTALVVPIGRSGTLNTNTAGMIELLNGSAQASAKLEVELYDTSDGTTWTVLQSDCTVIDDVIGNAADTVPAFPSVLALMAPGSTAPVNASAATVAINPTGADNSVLYTADEAGTSGNSITVAYATPATQATTAVSVATNAITVTPGTKARMLITGTFSPSLAPVLIYAGIANGKAMWSEDGTQGGALTGNDQLYYDGTKWVLFMTNTGPDYSAETAASSADYPDGLSFTPTTGTGTPTITAATSSADQVIAAVNASVAASDLVTASASGTVTGSVSAVSATNLTGGIDATATPPYIRTASSFLYVQESGTWKKTALSTL